MRKSNQPKLPELLKACGKCLDVFKTTYKNGSKSYIREKVTESGTELDTESELEETEDVAIVKYRKFYRT